MKLPIIIVAGTLTAAVAYNAYALTCGAQPSCDDLGYTLTSSADCLGTVLKCPFDKSKLFCTKKSEVTNLIVPNYKDGKVLSAQGTSYTVGSGNLASYSCGWVLFENYNTSSQNDNVQSKWYINDKLIGRQTSGTVGRYTDYNTAIYFVTKNDTFKNDGKAGDNLLTFFPCKGY